MTIRNKLAVIIAPIILISIVLMNVVFGIFFHHYVDEQETTQINIVKENIVSYLDEKKSKYIGSVNDWAHWDDTYLFAQNDNPDFEVKNIMDTTFTNLDINFFIITDQYEQIQYNKYYSFATNAFSDFPSDFSESFNLLLSSIKNEDNHYGIFQIGEDFYFVSLADITDSVEAKQADSKLIIGRQIDTSIIEEMNKMTGCQINAIHTVESFLAGNHSEPVLYSRYNTNDQYVINIELLIPNHDPGMPISIEMDFRRDLYKKGISKVIIFSIINTIASIAIAGFIVVLLGRFLTTPLLRLIKDVKNVDSAGEEFFRLKEEGHDEFYYLRKTVNHLLGRIEGAQNELKDNKEKLQATLLSVGDGVISVDKNGRIQFLNPAAQKLTGWVMQEAIQKPISVVFRIIDERSREPVESPVQTVYETEDVVEMSNHTLLVSKDGTERAIENTAAPIRDNVEIIGCVLVFRNVSERREKQRRIEYLSYHDQLTGVYNRRFFEEELLRLDVPINLPLSFLYIDVNGLKTVNDAFGHQVGDEFIKKISDVIKSASRSCDIIARIGGDEFVVILPNTIITCAEQIAMVIKDNVDKIRIMDIEISISIGWDTKNSADISTHDVLKRAEDLMYRKKIFNNTTKRSGIIQSILNSLMVKNPREEAHSKRVSDICMKIGKAYCLSDDDIKELIIIGELHDIGKIAIDEAILNKEGRLSESEWAQIKKHPETGYRLLGTSNEFINISEYILAHHERWDGKGYPRGLKGEEIPWKARVIAVADSYDAMTCDRPYRKALNKQEAIIQLKMNSGTQFDPEIVRIFIEKVSSNI